MEAKENYIVEGGTSYPKDTPAELIHILEQCRKNRTRIRIHLGDEKKPWLEEFDVVGYVGRSTGRHKEPLLIHNARSTRGGSLLTDCIQAVQETATGRYLWKSEHFRLPDIRIAKDHSYHKMLPYRADVDGKLHARFPSMTKANNWRSFMRGERMTK